MQIYHMLIRHTDNAIHAAASWKIALLPCSVDAADDEAAFLDGVLGIDL